MKLWNKGRFGFWIVGNRYMRRRDAMQLRLLELQGKVKERDRILIMLNDPEWHEESKDYSNPNTDLAHYSGYCWGCQLAAAIKKGN
jgi:hypothetical protein